MQVGLAIIALALGSPAAATSLRIKDVAEVVGTQPQQLIGYGLVVGLEGSGDTSSTMFTAQSLVSMLERLGVKVDPSGVEVENVAAVMVTAELPAFAAQGTTIDVTASSLGDAKSLQGGMLLPTPLYDGDGQLRAMAQGPISLGGFSAGGTGDRTTKNHQVVGRIPGGAQITQDTAQPVQVAGRICLALRQPDFTTAARIVTTINTHLGPGIARAANAAIIEVNVPPENQDMVGFVTTIEGLQVHPDEPARVVINERTGTVVIGQNVRILPVAIAHGSLTVRVRQEWQVSQPAPFSEEGTTVVVPSEETTVVEEDRALMPVQQQTTLEDLITGLNALGVTPRDLIAIIQALEEAGALQAELVIM